MYHYTPGSSENTGTAIDLVTSFTGTGTCASLGTSSAVLEISASLDHVSIPTCFRSVDLVDRVGSGELVLSQGTQYTPLCACLSLNVIVSFTHSFHSSRRPSLN
jgi:hypothetical protein